MEITYGYHAHDVVCLNTAKCNVNSVKKEDVLLT